MPDLCRKGHYSLFHRPVKACSAGRVVSACHLNGSRWVNRLGIVIVGRALNTPPIALIWWETIACSFFGFGLFGDMCAETLAQGVGQAGAGQFAHVGVDETAIGIEEQRGRQAAGAGGKHRLRWRIEQHLFVQRQPLPFEEIAHGGRVLTLVEQYDVEAGITLRPSANTGISRRQGGHQVAQRLSTTGLPLRSASLTGVPSSVAAAISGRGGAERCSSDSVPVSANHASSPATRPANTGRRSRVCRRVRHQVNASAAGRPIHNRKPPSPMATTDHGDAAYSGHQRST